MDKTTGAWINQQSTLSSVQFHATSELQKTAHANFVNPRYHTGNRLTRDNKHIMPAESVNKRAGTPPSTHHTHDVTLSICEPGELEPLPVCITP